MSTDPTPPVDPAATVLVGDEVASVVTEVLDHGEALTHAGVKVPFAVARQLVDKMRLAADQLEKQLRKATGGTKP